MRAPDACSKRPKNCDRMIEPDTTSDTLLNGRVFLRQPARGYRVGVDPVLLAAAVPVRNNEAVADLGAGAGAAALCLACRVGSAKVTAFEISGEFVALAQQNVHANDVEGRVTVVCADILDSRALPEAHFDHVLSNPPFYREGRGTASPVAGRNRSLRLDEKGIVAWVRSAAKVLKPGGSASFIFSADWLEVLLAAMTPRFGGLRIYPFWARAGANAKRVIVQGRKGSGAPTQFLPGMVLHNGDGSFTEAADAVLRGGRAINIETAT